MASGTSFQVSTWCSVAPGLIVSSGPIVYKNRYLLLACGYRRATVMDPDGAIRPSYGVPSTVKRTWKNYPSMAGVHYYNHFWVYDVKRNLYGTATKLPYDDHVPPTYVVKDVVYLFPNETAGFVWDGEYFGHHPEFVLKGQIEELGIGD